MVFTNEILKRDIENGSTKQSYLLLSSDILYLNEIAKWYANYFKVADVFWLSPKDEAKSISVEQTLDFCNKVNYASVGVQKLMIITDVCAMTIQAQNKMLKTLEDVRHDTVFLLLASNPATILPTIKSRCTIINVPPCPHGSMQEKKLIESNKNSDKIFESAKKLLACKTLDDAMPHVTILSAKENFEVAMIALHRELRESKNYAILKALSQINRNVSANCNPTNAFDLLLIELFKEKKHE